MDGETVLIETFQGGAVEWGVSFTSGNPEAADYVACASSDDAARLKEKVDGDRKKLAAVSGWIERWSDEKVSGDPWFFAAQEINSILQ
jgi:hypothetical protein